MKPLMTRMPLAIALTVMDTPAERAEQPMAPGDRDTTIGEAVDDRTAGDDWVDGPDSDQPIDDTWITTKVKSSLLADSDVSGLDIEVETVNGVVTLTGQVDEQAQIDRATEIARDIEGVTEVRTAAVTVEPRGD